MSITGCGRGIIFGHLVTAIIRGTKTQTRRPIRPEPLHADPPGSYQHCHHYFTGVPERGWAYYWMRGGTWNSTQPFFPRYKVGSCPWVREAWQLYHLHSDGDGGWDPYLWREAVPPDRPRQRHMIDYKADNSMDGPWRTPLHMPRWASRVQLEITDVRPEIVQRISEADAVAEGVESVEQFQKEWESLHGSMSWSVPTWVWVYTFRVVSNTGRPEIEAATAAGRG